MWENKNLEKFYKNKKPKTMKINSINNINYTGHTNILKNIKCACGEKFAKIDEIGEGTNIALDFLGKALIVPAIIMLTSKEDKDKKEYSALKNPLAATIQILLEAPILMLGSKFIENLANKNKLDSPKGDFSYNEAAAKEFFIEKLKFATKENSDLAKNCHKLVDRLNKKGLGKNLKEDFEQTFENYGENYKKCLKEALEKLDTTHKNLYHLQNRICFLAAIVLTPLLCKAEDYLFPKVMNLIINKKETQKPKGRKIFSIYHFKSQINKGGLK